MLGIKEWASEMIGAEDLWTPFMFDSAVSYFGIWVENKLNEMDYSDKKNVRPKYKLEDLLAQTPKASPLQLSGQGISHNLSGIRRVKRDK